MRSSSSPIGQTGGISAREREVDVVESGEDAGGDERRAETSAFLIRPVDELYRTGGRDAEVVQPAHDLEGGDHTHGTVVKATVGLTVEMAADHQRRSVGLAACARSEDAADAIHRDSKTGFLAKPYKSAAHVAISVGECKAVQPAFRSRAEDG